ASRAPSTPIPPPAPTRIRSLVTGPRGTIMGRASAARAATAPNSHAERLECNKGGDVTIFNDAMSGATMLGDFATQATNIKQHLSSAPSPRYVLVFMGHNDACTGTVDKTGNSCGGDRDPNNYCRTTNAAFEREF